MKRLSLLIALLVMLAGCGDTHRANAFQYKGSYVGNNSAVSGIAQTLPMHDCYKSIRAADIEAAVWFDGSLQ
ncbi:DUF4825 domain-containing protein [Exiguobacterium mexicanum]|uniref:DUF4825 domain-containing protein n=1 Tax=Exiguobacterium mexicanum TaxID=340146 RepID=UPI0037BFE757